MAGLFYVKCLLAIEQPADKCIAAKKFRQKWFMMAKDKKKPGPQQRLSQQLRANLLRRKAQARERARQKTPRLEADCQQNTDKAGLDPVSK